MSEGKVYSDEEIIRIKEQAIITAEVGDLKATSREIFSSLKSLNKAIGEIPIKITECRDAMDREIKEYMHDKFLTESDLRKFERQVEVKIDIVARQVSKATWVVSGFITAAMFITWIMRYTDIFQHVGN